MRTERRVLIDSLHFRPEPTGNAPYVTALALGLSARGTSVRVNTAQPHYPEWRIARGHRHWVSREMLADVEIERRLHYVPNPPRGIRRALSEITFGARLLLARRPNPDVLILVSPSLFASAMQLLRARLTRKRPKVLIWVQDLYSVGVIETQQGSARVANAVARVERWALRSADAVVVIHDRFAEVVRDRFSVPSDRIVTIRNWSHLPPLSESDVAKTRQKLRWGDDIIVLHAGAMGVKQGLENVIDAAKNARESGHPIRFVLLGDGGQKSHLQVLASGLTNVDFVAPLSDPEYLEALQAADILLVNEKPGVAEMAVPSKLTSYFAAGRPVIAATDPAGISASEIHSSGAGVVVPSGDPEALVSSIVAIAADPAAADAYGESGKRYRADVLDQERAIDRFDALLRFLHEKRDLKHLHLSTTNQTTHTGAITCQSAL